MSELKIPTIEELRKRLSERTATIRERLTSRLSGQSALLRGGSESGSQQRLFGEGKMINRVSERIDKTLKTLQERRPNIIPTVMERVKTYEPGKRITQLLQRPETRTTETPAATTATTATPVTEGKSKILRK